MKRLAGRKVFSVGKTVYTGEDVLLAGYLWGELAALEQRIRSGLAGIKAADPDEDAVDEAAEAWRYERDLLAADDLEAWLDERSVGVDEWSSFVGRQVASVTGAGKSGSAADADVEGVAYAEAVCSGLLADLAYRLAGRVAAGSASAPCPKTRLRAAVRALPEDVRTSGVLGLGRAQTLERAEAIACIDLRFDAAVDALTAPAALEREVEANTLEWTLLACQSVAFEDEGPAREAALLVRQDGLTLKKAAALAHASVETEKYVIEDVDPSIRDLLIGARPGQLVGPLRVGERFVLVSVTKRTEPSVDDPAVDARARRRIVARVVEREIAKRVRWHDRF